MDIREIDIDGDGTPDIIIANTNGDKMFFNPDSVKRFAKYLFITLVSVITGLVGASKVL